jgi:uncharacterized membrane protein YqhA
VVVVVVDLVVVVVVAGGLVVVVNAMYEQLQSELQVEVYPDLGSQSLVG